MIYAARTEHVGTQSSRPSIQPGFLTSQVDDPFTWVHTRSSGGPDSDTICPFTFTPPLVGMRFASARHTLEQLWLVFLGLRSDQGVPAATGQEQVLDGSPDQRRTKNAQKCPICSSVLWSSNQEVVTFRVMWPFAGPQVDF